MSNPRRARPYRVEDRQLLIHPRESETVNWIFDTYASTGSTTQMIQQMKEQNRLTKTGRHFCKQSLYKVLQNRVYLGMLSHKGKFYFDELKSHIIRSLVERVTLHDDDTIEVSWRTTDWLALLEAMKPGTIGAEMLEMEMHA